MIKRIGVLTSGGESSGMNAAGLAVAGTHIRSTDIGAGIPRYSVMMEILEHHNMVQSTIEFLQTVRHVGDGTVTLLDAAGDMAVYETGHTVSGIRQPEGGYVATVNHFVTSQLQNCWFESEPQEYWGNSEGRYARVTQSLRSSPGDVDLEWAMSLMASHDSPTYSICRHLGVNSADLQTISSVIYLPQEKQLYLASGMPCRIDFKYAGDIASDQS